MLSVAALAAPPCGCACCSNRGKRNVETQMIDAYTEGILDEVRFAESAHLYNGVTGGDQRATLICIAVGRSAVSIPA